MPQLNATHSATHSTQNTVHENLNGGFDLWYNGTYYTLAPFNLEGASTYTDGDTFPIAGYSWVSNHPKIDGHNGAESLFDYTNGGANVDIPSSFNAHNPRTNPVNDSMYFSAVKRDDNNNVLSENKILIYSVTPIYECLEKTIEWYADDYTFIVDKDGNYLLSGSGNVIIDNE